MAKEHAAQKSWAKAQEIAERYARRFGVSRRVAFYDKGQKMMGTVYVDLKDGKTKSAPQIISEPQPDEFVLAYGRRGLEKELIVRRIEGKDSLN